MGMRPSQRKHQMVGEYLYRTDPEMWGRILENLAQDEEV
jgi:hypothetical protein